MTKKLFGSALLACALMMFAAGCKKKTPAPPPPPPPPAKEKPAPPSKPSAKIDFFQAEPSSIQRGQSSTLRWSVKDASSVTIEPGIGTVDASGSRTVYPNDSTTYTLRASGDGGSDSRTARVTVTEPPPAPPAPRTESVEALSTMLERMVQDAYYDYDKYDIREDARGVLTRDADALKTIFGKYSSAVITIEGHCDERGSAEYNLGLGDRRATAAKEFLTQLGVGADKLKTISYGKERPQCTDSNESCWQKNRRAHFSAQ